MPSMLSDKAFPWLSPVDIDKRSIWRFHGYGLCYRDIIQVNSNEILAETIGNIAYGTAIFLLFIYLFIFWCE